MTTPLVLADPRRVHSVGVRDLRGSQFVVPRYHKFFRPTGAMGR